MIVLRCLVHCVLLKMSEAAEASIVVEPYQFEPILTESDLKVVMMIRRIAIMVAMI